MCGIIGYIGPNDTRKILINSLELLEYRGYDSAGVAFHEGNKIAVYKKAGRVSDLAEIVNAVKLPETFGGIGHTRWATHGAVIDKNAHPHQQGKVTLVHNGIIENYKELIKTYELESELKSDVDTEVAAALLNRFYDNDPYSAIRQLVSIIRGTFALAIMFTDRPNEIYAIRKVSPIVVCETENERVLASDLAPMASFNTEYYILPELTILKMDASGLSFTDLEGKEMRPDLMILNWEVEQINKQNYPFYMEKEICEQPEVVGKTINEYVKDGLPYFPEIPDSMFEDVREVVVVACGTSSHSGLVGKYLIEKHARVRTNVILASEFIYQDPILD